MENEQHFKSTLQVWYYLRDALNNNYNTLQQVNNVANNLLNSLNKSAVHYVSNNGDYVVLSTSKTVSGGQLE